MTEREQAIFGWLRGEAERTRWIDVAAEVVAPRIAALEVEVERLRLIERRARSVSDFLYEHGWQKIMADGRLNETMFGNLFMLRDALSGTPTYPDEVE